LPTTVKEPSEKEMREDLVVNKEQTEAVEEEEKKSPAKSSFKRLEPLCFLQQ